MSTTSKIDASSSALLNLGCLKILRSSASFPISQSAIDLFAAFPSYKSRVAEQRTRMLRLLRSLIDKIETEGGDAVCSPLELELKEWSGEVSKEDEITGKSQQIIRSKKRPFSVVTGSEESMRPLFDVVDRLREATEACIDEANGEGATQQVALLNKALGQGANASESSKFNSSTRGNRPQANFVPAIDNSRKAARASTTLHPHRQVIEDLVFSELQTSKASPPQNFLKLSDVECDFIETREKLDEMIAHLDGVSEIAIDLEAHSLRSFQGFTCLLQISSRTRDFLVDALALRPYLRSLNRVTTNPSILKVLHGCDSDVLWLQRDFNVYLVNVFDTGQAARVLAYPSFGLAYLLQTFANVTAQKQFQMADWRQRPIPQALLKYAREDTHYLLGIYDRVKNELIESSSSTSRVKVGELQGTSNFVDVPSLLHQVINRSNEITLKVYQIEKFRPFAYRRLLGKLGGSDSLALNDPEGREGDIHPAVDPRLSPRSRVFAALFDWRDAIAREEDESTHFVLPNQLLNRIADVIPATVEALVRCCSPPPSCVRARLFELVSIITAARDCKVSGPLAVSIADTNADTTTSQPLQSFSSNQPKGTALVLESNRDDQRLSGIHSTHLNKVPSSSSLLHVHSDSSLSVGSDFEGFGLKIPANGWLKVPSVSINSSLKMSEPSPLFASLQHVSSIARVGAALSENVPIKSCIEILDIVLATRPKKVTVSESKVEEKEIEAEENVLPIPESLSQKFFPNKSERKAETVAKSTLPSSNPSPSSFDYTKLTKAVVSTGDSSHRPHEKRRDESHRGGRKKHGKKNPYTK